MTPYSQETIEIIRKLYNKLSEKDKRLYAATEALKLGHGGVENIAQILGCARSTLHIGIVELKSLPADCRYDSRIRQPGGGRKPYDQTIDTIDEAFFAVVKNHTAGDPMDENVRWTNLTHADIAQRLETDHGISVSKTVIGKLLKKHNFVRRKAVKKQTIKSVENRNEQFENIAKLSDQYLAAGNPVISIDTKKKEYIGNFYREGHLYTTGEIQTFDHDFNSYADGVIIPHGIYDIKHNKGFINLGTSRDTSEFACDSLRNWWYSIGQHDYPDATEILIRCDGGGSNSSLHYIFKADLQDLANEIGIPIRVAHYPPYCSKYNPIEHRLFPHVTRACQGIIFKSVKLVKDLMAKTKTKQGLSVTVNILDKVYQVGRKVVEGFKENMKIVFDDNLAKWNYTAVPQTAENVGVI